MMGLALVWLAGQLLLWGFRPGYLFPPFDQVDMWFYTTDQWDWSGMLEEFGSTYYGVRISWLFLGAAFHALFDPIIANIGLKLLFSAVYASALAWLELRFGSFLGGVCGVCLAIFFLNLSTALHGDHTDSAVLVYATFSVVGIIQAGLTLSPYRWIFFGGVSFSLMALGNLGAIANIGAAIALFHLAWLNRNLMFHGKCLLVYGAAALLTLTGFQIVHSSLGAT